MIRPRYERYAAARRGFTIVELLIVIVVIGVLASITIVAFNNVQNRARDTQRISDMRAIARALEAHKTRTGSYPAAVGTTNASGWEVSHNGTGTTNFLSALVSATDGVSRIPVDPANFGTNSGVAGSLNPSRSSANYMYFYHRYAAGSNGCDITKGDFYVLGVTRMDTVASGGNHPQSPGFTCTSSWATSGAWTTGAYTNG